MKTKKILALALAAVLLVAVGVGGTLAWLVAETEAVENTFAPSDLGVDIEESENNYKIIPGGDDDKDPKAWITTGSEPAYLFVVITETNNIFTANGTTHNYVDYTLASGWNTLSGPTTADGVITTVIWRSVSEQQIKEKYDILAGNKVYYNTEITKATMPTTATQPEITFQAYACQSANVADAATAWSYIQNGGLTPVAGS